jgi:formate dehydrogenase subunit gamma
MRHGTVDESWAKAHHALWYDEVQAGVAPGTFEDGTPPDQRPPAGNPPPRPAH